MILSPGFSKAIPRESKPQAKFEVLAGANTLMPDDIINLFK